MPSSLPHKMQTVQSPQELNLQLSRARAICMATLYTVATPPSNPLSATSMHRLQRDVSHTIIDASWLSGRWKPWLTINRSKLCWGALSIGRLAQLSHKSTPILKFSTIIRLPCSQKTLLCQCKKNLLPIHLRNQSSLKCQLLKNQICQWFKALEACLSKASSMRVIEMFREINSVTRCRRFLTELNPILSRWLHMLQRRPLAMKATIVRSEGTCKRRRITLNFLAVNQLRHSTIAWIMFQTTGHRKSQAT